MSGGAVSASHLQAEATPESWQIRDAEVDDVARIAAAVAELLVELGATPPSRSGMEEAARSLLQDPGAGALLVAETERELVGVLTASWQTAIHVPGRYGLIQDLWVQPSWRSQRIGGALLDAMAAQARESGITRVEVCLPKETFAGLSATAAFYRANGFEPLGPRMRRALA